MSDHLKKRKNAVLLRNINLQSSLRSLLQTLPLQANLISPILSLTALRRGWTMTGSVYHGSQILRASTAASQPRQWRVRFWFVVRHFENRMAGIQGTATRALVRMSGGFWALSRNDKFRVRYDRWIKEVKTHFLQAQPPSKVIYWQSPPRKRPVYYSVYCVYSYFKYLLAGISEYFTLCRG